MRTVRVNKHIEYFGTGDEHISNIALAAGCRMRVFTVTTPEANHVPTNNGSVSYIARPLPAVETKSPAIRTPNGIVQPAPVVLSTATVSPPASPSPAISTYHGSERQRHPLSNRTMPPAASWQWSSQRWTPVPRNAPGTLSDIEESTLAPPCSADDDHHPAESCSSSYNDQSRRPLLATLFDQPPCTSTVEEGGIAQIAGESTPIGQQSNVNDARGLTQRCYDVFLGGSCGRTTWRQELVMPILERHGIRYYNPQVDLWTAQLIDKEEHAKQNSEYLLFVLDPSTVNAATFVEIPYLIARGAKLVIVHLQQDAWLQNGHKCDRVDRLRLIAFLRSIVEYHNIPLFSTVHDGVQYLLAQLVGRMSPFTAVYHKETRSLYRQVQLDRLRKWLEPCKQRITWENFKMKCKDALDILHNCLMPAPSTIDVSRTTLVTGELTFASGTCMLAYVLGTVSPLGLLVALLVAHVSLTLGLKYNGRQLTAKQRRQRYAKVLLDMRRSSIPVRRRLTMDSTASQTHGLVDTLNVGRNLLWRSGSVHNRVQTSSHFDLYVGGSGGDSDLEWLPRVAYPLLHAHNISYADMNMYGDFVQRAALLPRCKTIVYHMSSPLSALSGLAECAYLMGMFGSRVVASIPPWCINVMVCECFCQSTERTIGVRNRCYHRAFEYVRDIALRNQCHLFKRAEDALHHSITSTAKRRRHGSGLNSRMGAQPSLLTSVLVANNNNNTTSYCSTDVSCTASMKTATTDSEESDDERTSDSHRASIDGLPGVGGAQLRPPIQLMHSLST